MTSRFPVTSVFLRWTAGMARARATDTTFSVGLRSVPFIAHVTARRNLLGDIPVARRKLDENELVCA